MSPSSAATSRAAISSIRSGFRIDPRPVHRSPAVPEQQFVTSVDSEPGGQRVRRVRVSTAVSTRGRGEKADRGTTMPRDAVNHLDAQLLLAYLLTTPRCSTRSARCRVFCCASSARSSAAVMPNGGFATTRKAVRGQRKSSTSPATIVTGSPANRNRSCRTLSGCSSTARTSAPAATNAAVSTPVPAPISTTRAPGSMPALSTIRRAQSASSRCQPHRRSAPGCSADTTHHREHDHGLTVSPRTGVAQQVFTGVSPPPTPIDPRRPLQTPADPC